MHPVAYAEEWKLEAEFDRMNRTYRMPTEELSYPVHPVHNQVVSIGSRTKSLDRKAGVRDSQCTAQRHAAA
jgi:hypothetical protein